MGSRETAATTSEACKMLDESVWLVRRFQMMLVCVRSGHIVLIKWSYAYSLYQACRSYDSLSQNRWLRVDQYVMLNFFANNVIKIMCIISMQRPGYNLPSRNFFYVTYIDWIHRKFLWQSFSSKGAEIRNTNGVAGGWVSEPSSYVLSTGSANKFLRWASDDALLVQSDGSDIRQRDRGTVSQTRGSKIKSFLVHNKIDELPSLDH
jgi:hypothetical protein